MWPQPGIKAENRPAPPPITKRWMWSGLGTIGMRASGSRLYRFGRLKALAVSASSAARTTDAYPALQPAITMLIASTSRERLPCRGGTLQQNAGPRRAHRRQRRPGPGSAAPPEAHRSSLARNTIRSGRSPRAPERHFLPPPRGLHWLLSSRHRLLADPQAVQQ